ncbi:hypothetical protein N665_0052s0014 [Sinapis alba]|nr:hypothetical protein N665_0052s0014 [Sinapis alba]
MDSNSWINQPSFFSSSSSQRCRFRSVGCFCAYVFDNTGLCCPTYEEHLVKAKTRVLFCGWEVNGIDTHRCFFVPHYMSEVRWIDNELTGLLLFPFNSILGGTAASLPYFNNKNPKYPNLHIPH